MKAAINFIIFFLFLSCQQAEKTSCNYITDYYPYTYKAEIEYYLGNYEKSFELYKKALKYCEAVGVGTHQDARIFARVCAKLGKEALALEYIEKRFSNGGILQEFQNDSIFTTLLNKKNGQKIVSDYDLSRTKFIDQLNFELRSELQNMIKLDQQNNMTKFQDSMFLVNDKRLVQIFETYGYPSEKVIGPFNVDQIQAEPSILLLHSNDSIRLNYFIPKIKKYVEDGQCSPYVLGIMLDNLELFNDRPQTHGTYLNGNGGYAKMISDKSKVNSNRKSIGLPPLEISKKLDSLKSL
tara:strand:- start:265 stop:1149 length:885 start_codon:yes stop_codon:yes gene_type:complete